MNSHRNFSKIPSVLQPFELDAQWSSCEKEFYDFAEPHFPLCFLIRRTTSAVRRQNQTERKALRDRVEQLPVQALQSTSNCNSDKQDEEKQQKLNKRKRRSRNSRIRAKNSTLSFSRVFVTESVLTSLVVERTEGKQRSATCRPMTTRISSQFKRSVKNKKESHRETGGRQGSHRNNALH